MDFKQEDYMSKNVLLAAIVALLSCFLFTSTLSFILYKKQQSDEENLIKDCDKEFPTEDIETENL